MKKLFAHVGLPTVLLIGSVGPAWAIGFRATMEPIKVDARPGQVVSRGFQLTLAKEEQRTQFKAHVEDWWRSEDGKQSFYRPPGTLARSCAPWVKLNPVEAAVEPGGTLDLRITVAVPADAKPGGYWCALTLDEVPDPLKVTPDEVGVRFLASISTGIFVSIGPVERIARIAEVQVLPDEATLKLRNDGNCPLSVEGRFEFIRPGETTPTVVLPFPHATLLPEPINTALFTAKLPDATKLPSGTYLVRAIFDIGLDHYLGGQKELRITRETPSSIPPDRTAR
jgi:hypothetical protein